MRTRTPNAPPIFCLLSQNLLSLPNPQSEIHNPKFPQSTMSHFTTIQTQIRDLDALRDACGELGLGFQTNARCRGYAGQNRVAPHVIRLKGPYDIAVEPSSQTQGAYDLTTDWWDGHVAREVGTGFGRLLQAYGIHKTTREAQARGLRIQRALQQDGSVLLTLEGGRL